MTTERTVRALDDAVEDAKTLIDELTGRMEDLEAESTSQAVQLDDAQGELDLMTDEVARVGREKTELEEKVAGLEEEVKRLEDAPQG